MQRASEVRDERSGERNECHSFFFFINTNSYAICKFCLKFTISAKRSIFFENRVIVGAYCIRPYITK